MLTQFRYAQVTFASGRVTFRTYHHPNDLYPASRAATTTIFCEGWQVSHMAQVLGQFSATLLLSTVVHLRLDVETEWVGPS